MSYDIQEVLRSVQDGAPAPHTTTDDIIARAKRTRARRTVAVGAAGVAACLAIVAGAASLPGGSADVPAAGQPAASSLPRPTSTGKPLPVKRIDFTSTLGTYRVGPYQVGPAGQVTAGYQQIPVYRDGDIWTDDDQVNYPYAGAMITVYAPGVYDPGSFTFGEDTTLKISPQYPVTIGDHPGLAIDFTYLQPDNRSNKFVRTALAWQYKPGAWATLVPQYDHGALPRADAIQIAAGLVTSAKKQQLRVPYKLGYLPTGWQVVGVSQTPSQITSDYSAVYLHQGPLANPSVVLDASAPNTVVIGVSKKGKPKEHLVEGLNCFGIGNDCTILKGDYLISVGSWDLSDGTVRKIAEGLQFKNIADQSTWITPNA